MTQITTWTPEEDARLISMRASDWDTTDMSKDLGRSENSIKWRISQLLKAGKIERKQVSDTWTPERLAKLRSLWAEKSAFGGDAYTASQIAEQLGLKSRHQVIGKAHRLGLPKRPGRLERIAAARARQQTPPAPRCRKRKPIPADSSVIPMPKAQEDEAMLEDDTPVIVPRRAAGFKVCQWISGKPSRDDSCKCGAPVVPSPLAAPYCAKHAAMSVVKPAKVERDAA